MKITDLEPKLLWECFDEITKVPRPTHHLEKMKKFLVDWANRHNIEVATDEVGNVVMKKAATPGMTRKRSDHHPSGHQTWWPRSAMTRNTISLTTPSPQSLTANG